MMQSAPSESGGGWFPSLTPPTYPFPSPPPAEKPATDPIIAGAREAIAQYVADQTNRPQSKVLWNPPIHKLTKAPKIDWSGALGQGNPVPDADPSPTMSKNTPVFHRLGAIYTDPWTAYGDGSTGGGQNDLFKSGVLWGCLFHYNPTSVAYGVANSDDLTTYAMGSQSGMAFLVPGTVSITLELYFNRIYDLAAPAGAHYGRPLTAGEQTMLRLRGTEYDIEFLYRAANGDPRPVRHAPWKTSDYGFMMRSLLRLNLGTSFTYIVLPKSMAVDHLLFTEDMVPTFSRVTLTLDRQVTLGDTGAEAKKIVEKYKGSTNSDTGTTGQ